jgi:hypothetical protein
VLSVQFIFAKSLTEPCPALLRVAKVGGKPVNSTARHGAANSSIAIGDFTVTNVRARSTMVRNAGRVTRFVVMAVLQAARAESLGLPHDSALSWGLNRAIFYAAAKSGFKEPVAGEKPGEPSPAPSRDLYRLGDDEAYVSPNVKPLTFAIGGEDQTAEKFERQVIARFGTQENFRKAWSEATQIMGTFDRSVLESRRGFYEQVYKPRRDELSDLWTQQYSPPPKKPTRR